MATPPSMPNVSAGGFPLQGAPLPRPGAIPLPPFVTPPIPATSLGYPPPPMHPMMVPPGAGLMPPVMPVPFPTANVPKSTDVYIGKIPNAVEDDTIKSLLEVCGEVRSWKRAEDPDTQQPKGFGFCEFEEAEGVLRATRLLNNLKVDNQELQARSSTATAKYVDAYQREKAMRGPEDKEEGEHVETEEQKDAKLREKIQKILEDRNAEKHKSKETQNPAAKDPESEDFRHDTETADPRDRRYARHRRGSVERRSERELSRDRREVEMLIRDEESAYRKRLQEWESYERRIEKELQRESDIQRALERERARARRVDHEEDSDDDRAPWARKPYKNSRRAEVRRRRRREEEGWDEADRAKEEKESEMKRQKSEEPEDMELDTTPQEPPPEEEEERPNGVEAKAEEKAEPVPPEVLTGGSFAMTLTSKKQTKPAVAAPPTESSALKDIFGEDEEEKPRREARGLAFSEIDTRPTPDPKDAAKNLIETLPKTKDEIYNYAIKWEAYQSDVVGAKIESWLNKKISEILGFEETSLTSFIMAQLNQHQPPSELEKELAEVLDDEQQTETFIIKLYRTVIYETEKAAASQDA